MREKVTERPLWACQFEKPSTSPNSLEASTTVMLSMTIHYFCNAGFRLRSFSRIRFQRNAFLQRKDTKSHIYDEITLFQFY